MLLYALPSHGGAFFFPKARKYKEKKMNDKAITELLQDLIRIPSESNGITGYENDVQQFFYSWLKAHGLEATLTYIEDIPDFDAHPGRRIDHNMRNRPIVTAALKGNRPGKKILLLAHADTVLVGKLSDWERSPFSGDLIDGMIYGRGASDDKCGMAVMAGVMAQLKEDGCDFPGELIIASVPNEESGGGNGTVAVFATGITADEAIYLDGGSNQTIWNAGLGGGSCRVYGEDPNVIREKIISFKNRIKEKLDLHPSFGPEFFSLIDKQFYLTSSYQDGSVSAFLDVLPGESEEEMKKDFESMFENCSFTWTSRFLKTADIPKDSPLVLNLQKAFTKVTGRNCGVIGGVQSDQGLVVMYGKTPCILFGCGRRGLPGSSHLPNERVEEVRLHETFHTILEFVKG